MIVPSSQFSVSTASSSQLSATHARETGRWNLRTSACRQLLLEQLPFVQQCVEAATTDKRVVIPSLGDAAAIDHEDLIGVTDGRDPVRDNNRGSLPHHTLQPHQNLLFRI